MANLDRFRELLMGFESSSEDSRTLLEVLLPYTSRKSFSEEGLRSSTGSEAAAQLCTWVKGVERFVRG